MNENLKSNEYSPINDFVIKCSDDKIAIGHIIYLDKCVYIWISCPNNFSNSVGDMGNLVTAVQTKFDNMPLSTTLFCENDDQFSQNIAIRLSKKFNIQIFMSSNLPIEYEQNIQEIESDLCDKLSVYLT